MYSNYISGMINHHLTQLLAEKHAERNKTQKQTKRLWRQQALLQSLYYKTGLFKYIAMYLNDRYA